MALTITTDHAEIAAVLAPVIRADPVRTTVLGSVAAQLADGAWCAYGGASVAVRSQTSRPVVLSPAASDCGALAAALATLPDIAALTGPPRPVDALVPALGRAPRRRVDERLFRLDRLVPPAGVTGTARAATSADVDLVLDLARAFQRETYGRVQPGFDAHRFAVTAVESGRTWLWAPSPAGPPVAMATRRPSVEGVARIGPVYTVPTARGHGYGSAVTARAAADVLEDGAVAVLFTDLANPTSNHIYRAIGFRPVCDWLLVEFG